MIRFIPPAALIAMLTAACSSILPTRDIPYPTASAAPGTHAVSWSYFSFAVPNQWRQREEAENGGTDWYDAGNDELMHGDVFTGCGNAQRPENPLPKLVSYHAHTQIQVARQTHLSAPGAAGGWRYELTGADGRPHTAISVWISGCNKELWLVVNAESNVVDRIAGSIIAAEKKK